MRWRRVVLAPAMLTPFLDLPPFLDPPHAGVTLPEPWPRRYYAFRPATLMFRELTVDASISWKQNGLRGPLTRAPQCLTEIFSHPCNPWWSPSSLKLWRGDHGDPSG